jgi:hypothetical protein
MVNYEGISKSYQMAESSHCCTDYGADEICRA